MPVPPPIRDIMKGGGLKNVEHLCVEACMFVLISLCYGYDVYKNIYVCVFVESMGLCV